MMELYDPTGGHDAYLAEVQDRMQRLCWHIEDETGRPLEVDRPVPQDDKREEP